MIRYALRCARGHDFESWFRSAGAFDDLSREGRVACPVCATREVAKSLMAPMLGVPGSDGSPTTTSAAQPGDSPPRPADDQPPDTDRDRRMRAALTALRQHVEANSEYVGLNFAAEARRIHDGDVPGRSIYGEAKAQDARRLLEDGVPVAPLPFLPSRKMN